ncbi:MAG: hypothetical protein HDQ87_00995 [Clostridia bacterium]|nr:hypothetical protein [Clostridia bacterium]
MEIHLPAEQFCPDHVFSCGQTFRFHREDGVWRGVAMGSIVEAEQTGTAVRLRAEGGSQTEDAWRRYFDLGSDYAALLPADDPVLWRAIESAPGLRVLNQEPFETLISFIISANNNIPRITRIIEALCREAGRPFAAGGREYWTFPEAEQLAALSEERLRALGAGYRAPYILAASERAAREDIGSFREMPTGEALRRLQEFPGVGPKVAGCIALFALGKRDAFPADVWIRRIIRQLYGFDGRPKQVAVFAAERFGAGAGIAQQYLFHYARRYLQAGT